MDFKPNVDIRLSDLKLFLGPELRIVYPLILNFGVSGELELNGLADPKWIQPKGILTFENGDVNLVATQVSPVNFSWIHFLFSCLESKVSSPELVPLFFFFLAGFCFMLS